MYTNHSAKTVILDVQDGGSIFLKNVGNHPQDFVVHQCVNLRSLFLVHKHDFENGQYCVFSFCKGSAIVETL